MARGGSDVADGAGTGKLAGGEAAGDGWAAATVVFGGAANAAVGVAAVAWDAICSWALAKSLVRIRIWSCIDWMTCSILEDSFYPSSGGDHRFHGVASEFLDFCRQGVIESDEKSVNRVPLCRFLISGMQVLGEFLGLSCDLNYFF